MHRIDDTINLVGQHKYVITSDLQDSFNQRKITADKLPYMAFHSPFGDDYIFLRSPQGMLNQSEELERMMITILTEEIAAGWVAILADNLYILGDTEEEAIVRWDIVLRKLDENNIKLTGKKTYCFPNKLDILGWIKEGDYLSPCPHRQNTLLSASLPTTYGELRSYLGTWHTLYKCKKDQYILLSPLTKLLSTCPKSSTVIPWTTDTIRAFEISKEEAKHLDKLYIPKITDQLVLTADYAERGTDMKKGISGTLWARVTVDGKD